MPAVRVFSPRNQIILTCGLAVALLPSAGTVFGFREDAAPKPRERADSSAPTDSGRQLPAGVPVNSQKETSPPLTPAAALASVKVPDNLRLSLFAHEPMVTQPIEICFDHRHRMWVAENDTYADSKTNFDLRFKDRIVILDDTDGDGRADRRTLFADGLERLTSIAPGFGGVYAIAAPTLLFIPDADGDDRPDGPPQVLLDGFNADTVRHNLANGLRWGPDGWLYGRHGIQAMSHVGPPGAAPEAREKVDCCVWRFHPLSRRFEVVCRGTTNPWGMDFTADGELFFINTVIGHLWHAIPGGHFQRMYGEDPNPRLYRLMSQVADHVHWAQGENWNTVAKVGISADTDKAGGGHAHCGLLIPRGDHWPESIRDKVLTLNFHGRRVNVERLERHGAGYVARHEPDMLFWGDVWFRGVQLIEGPDGAIYIADWSDIGECHENDGVHRTSGRIYRLTVPDWKRTPKTRALPADPASADDVFRFAADPLDRVRLQELAAEKKLDPAWREALGARADDITRSPLERLDALFSLHVTGGAGEPRLLKLLEDREERVAARAIQLLVDDGRVSEPALRAFQKLAAETKSGLVLLHLASTLRLPGPMIERMPGLAINLLKRTEFRDDRDLPLMIWYGVEGMIDRAPSAGLALASVDPASPFAPLAIRRLTENGLDGSTGAALVKRLAGLLDEGVPGVASAERWLAAMEEGLRGRRKVSPPAGWNELAEKLRRHAVARLGQLEKSLSVVFGSGRAMAELKAIATDGGKDPVSRRSALESLAEAKAPGTADLLRGLVGDRDLGPWATRALAGFDEPATVELLVERFPKLNLRTRQEAAITLASRPAWAKRLLASISAGRIDRDQVSPTVVRQIRETGDVATIADVSRLWPELKPLAGAQKEKLEAWKKRLTPTELARADRSAGRAVFKKQCANCHVLFGDGERTAPELTGSQRTSLEYLLENLIEPSAQVAAIYRTSTVALTDGRVLTGIVVSRTERSLDLQTATQRMRIPAEEIESVKPSAKSLMPEGVLETLKADEVRDLIAYLMSPSQVPLPAER